MIEIKQLQIVLKQFLRSHHINQPQNKGTNSYLSKTCFKMFHLQRVRNLQEQNLQILIKIFLMQMYQV